MRMNLQDKFISHCRRRAKNDLEITLSTAIARSDALPFSCTNIHLDWVGLGDQSQENLLFVELQLKIIPQS